MSREETQVPCPRCNGPMAIGVEARRTIWECADCGHVHKTDTYVTAPDRKPAVENLRRSEVMSQGTTPKAVITFPVSFGNVSIGDNTAGIPVRIDRSRLNPVAADDLLCGHRLNARLAVGDRDDDPDQQVMFDDMDYHLSASFEVKGYSVKPKYIKATFNVCLNDIAIEDLGHFAKRSGQLAVDGVEPLPDGEDDGDD